LGGDGIAAVGLGRPDDLVDQLQRVAVPLLALTKLLLASRRAASMRRRSVTSSVMPYQQADLTGLVELGGRSGEERRRSCHRAAAAGIRLNAALSSGVPTPRLFDHHMIVGMEQHHPCLVRGSEGWTWSSSKKAPAGIG
jgi:hypothetical protein